MTKYRIGLLAFPAVTQLDLTGPLQVFSGLPGAPGPRAVENARPDQDPWRADADTRHDAVRLSRAGCDLRAGRLRRYGSDGRPGRYCPFCVSRRAEATFCRIDLHWIAGAGGRRDCCVARRRRHIGRGLDLLAPFGVIQPRAVSCATGMYSPVAASRRGLILPLTMVAELAGRDAGGGHPAWDRIRPCPAVRCWQPRQPLGPNWLVAVQARMTATRAEREARVREGSGCIGSSENALRRIVARAGNALATGGGRCTQRCSSQEAAT